MLKTALEVTLYCAVASLFGFSLISTYKWAFKDDDGSAILMLWIAFAFFLGVGIWWIGV